MSHSHEVAHFKGTIFFQRFVPFPLAQVISMAQGEYVLPGNADFGTTHIARWVCAPPTIFHFPTGETLAEVLARVPCALQKTVFVYKLVNF